jgi:hypothetical protein
MVILMETTIIVMQKQAVTIKGTMTTWRMVEDIRAQERRRRKI